MYYHYNTVICTNQVFILYLYVVFAVNCPKKSACLKLLYIYTYICIFIHTLCKEYTRRALRRPNTRKQKEKLPQNKIAPRQCHGAKLKINVFIQVLQLYLQSHFILSFFVRSCRGIMQKNTSNSTTTDGKCTKSKTPSASFTSQGGGVFYLRFRNNIQSICICNIIPREINIIFDEIIEKAIYCQCVFVQLFKILLSNHCKVEVVRGVVNFPVIE